MLIPLLGSLFFLAAIIFAVVLPRHVLKFITLSVTLFSVVMLILEAREVVQWPMDAHYYVGKALSLIRGEGLRLPWNIEIDTKFFPGYSVALALAYPLTGGQLWFWIPIQISAYLLSVWLLWLIARDLVGASTAWVAAALWASHPILLQWAPLPMAELWATTMALAAVACHLKGQRDPDRKWALLAGIFAGWAIASRIEMASLGFLLLCRALWLRRLPQRQWMAWGAAGFVIGAFPLITWLLTLPGSESTSRLSYVNEFFHHGVPPDLASRFRNAMQRLTYLPTFRPSQEWVIVWQIPLNAAAVVAVGMGLLGWFGAWGVVAAAWLLCYLGVHQLWYYEHGRFNLPVLPVASLLLAAAAKVWVTQGKQITPKTRVIATVLLSLTIISNFLYGDTIQRLHARLLVIAEPWDPVQVAAIIDEETPEGSPIITDLGPTLAWRLDRAVVFNEPLPDFYEADIAPEQTLNFIQMVGITAVVLKQDVDEWLREAQIPRDLALQIFRPIGTGSQVAILIVNPQFLAERN